MLCQECRKNEATVHIVKNICGKHTELNLCEACARKKEELDFTFEAQLSLPKLFAGLLNQGFIDGGEVKQEAKLICPACGLSFAQFSQVGRLGCSHCFKAFEGKLKPLLRRIHGAAGHTGKVPAAIAGRVQARREIDHLKVELKTKVQAEAFEEAALIRDRIRRLEAAVPGAAPNKGPAAGLDDAGCPDCAQGEEQ